jgi:hypothetical protein
MAKKGLAMGNIRRWKRRGSRRRKAQELEQPQPVETHADRLRKQGLELPAPDLLDDESLSRKLWELIHVLAEQKTILDNTDHLSDRELYTYLVEEDLAQEYWPPFHEDAVSTIDPVMGGDDEGMRLYLRYYADEETRSKWAETFWVEEMPPSETPPYDRDSQLPNSVGVPWTEEDFRALEAGGGSVA